MSLLIESIRLENGVFNNLSYHARRMNQARLSLFTGVLEINLDQVLMKENFQTQGLFKCKVVYDDKIKNIEYQPYTVKYITSLKLVCDDSIDYSFKYQNRESINELFSKKELCDDVLIVKNGLVTDTSYANIVFKSGNEWLTPKTPLLTGTMRESLLDARMIQEAEIEMSDIVKFESFKIINAMIGNSMPEVSIKNIVA
jgi:4-amino-4-deoxychorismate lyase